MAYLQYPVLWGKAISKKMLLKLRKESELGASTLSKGFKSPKFRATEKIMKYKKQKYYG